MKNKYSSLARGTSKSFLKIFSWTLVVLFATFASGLNGQVSSYTFSSSTGTYTPISGGTQLGTATTDDDVFGALPIGFSFCYNGTTYTTFGVNSNGWISLGSTTPASSYTALSTGSTNNVIAGFNFDIQGEPTTGYLQYLTTGVSPNQTLIVQWTDFDAFSSTTNTDNYNFQIRLNETSNTIEVVYGSYTVNAAFRAAQVGLRGATNADFNNRMVSNGVNTWATTLPGSSNADICEVNNLPLVPASGLTFTWTLPAAPATPINGTFTAVTTSGMTVNWEDNSTNEANFIVQRSTDNIVFTTVATIPSTSIGTTGTPYNYVATGLFSNTLYYWRIISSNANCGSSFLAMQQTTLSGTMCGTYTVGPTGTYTSLTAAFAAVAANGVLCPLVFDLQAAYVSTVETFPITIPFLGTGPGTNITVRPELGATNLSITSNATQTILFNGATYVTFDGRPGSSGIVRELTIANTITTGTAASFTGDASNCGFMYCNIEGVTTGTTNGVIAFTSSTTNVGQSGHNINNCEFRPGASTPQQFIYSVNSTVGAFNSATISNNFIHDWFLATSANNAINVANGNTNWTISNNSFYQTANRTYTTAATHNAITFSSATNSYGHTVSGNFIGGTAASCGGTPWTMLGAVASRFIGINMTVGTVAASNVQGNTIRNFSFATTSGATTLNGIWAGISITSGNVNVGTTTPNTIGSTTTNGAVTATTTVSGGLLVGINSSAAAAAINIANNMVGGLTCLGSTATIVTSVVGIQASSSSTITITGNTVGSTTMNNSLINATGTVTTTNHVTGILCTSTSANTITNNTIMNLSGVSSSTSTGAQVRGIVATTGLNTITGNTISNLANLSPQAGTTTTSSVLGISQQSTSTLMAHNVSNNTITNLGNGATTASNVSVTGIYMTGSTTQLTNQVSRNTIRALASASTGSPVISGIQINGGIIRVYNNMVMLGLDAAGSAITAAHEFNGIYKTTANRASILFNSVSIAGTGVNGGAANTYAYRRTLNPAAAPSDSLYSNIFSNTRSNGTSTGTHYSVSVNNTTNFVGDGNVYYGNGTGYQTGAVGVTNYATLPLWAAATAQDANSFQVDPNFISATNLHINNTLTSVLESRAVAVGSINTDIDADNRPGPTGSVNGGATNHDIGADEFDGIPVSVDIGIQSLVLPSTSGCHTNCEIVRVRLRNFTPSVLNMAVNNVTITSSTTGPNPQTFAVLTITSGTIAANGFLDTAVAMCYDMTAVGTHVFNASASTGSDFITSNNAMAPVSILISGGVATSNRPSVCQGDSALITLSGMTNGGTIQWQSSPDNIVWTNIPGATSNPLNTGALSDTTYFRAISCGLHNSTSDTVLVAFLADPVTTGTTRCGAGSVTTTASGTGTLNWFDAPNGGNQVNSGTSYTTNITNTTTWYVENSSGTPPTTHTTTFAAGNGSNGNMFTITAINTVTITGFDGHVTTGTSDWRIDYRPNDYLLVPGANTSPTGWLPLGTATAVPAGGTGLPTPIPITFSVTIPAGQTYSFHVMTIAGSGVQYTNGTGAGNVYNANADFQFREGHGGVSFNCTNVPRVFNGRIHYSSGCSSFPRVAVTATITPADTIIATVSNSICDSGSATIEVTSLNTGYQYNWTPATGLNMTTGDSVISTLTLALGTQTYLVSSLDTTTGCQSSTTAIVNVNPSPDIVASVSNDTVCANTQVTLGAAAGFTNPVIVGTGLIQNTNTTYPAPYGNFYWGSRHQMLVLASELSASGLTAGYINALSFEVGNINGTQPLDNFEIKLGLTSITSITAFQLSPMTSVYTNPSYMPVPVSVNTHNFTTPFYWDGISNLIVETCHNNTSFIANVSVRQSATPFTSTVYYRADAGGVCSNTLVTGSIAQRPNMRFWRSTSNWTYIWTPASGLSDSTSTAPTVSPAVTTTYYVTATDTINGCTDIDSIRVVVNPLPPLALGSDTSICSANTPYALNAPVGGYSYLWNTGDTISSINLSSSDTIYVDVTDTITGCMSTDTIMIMVNPSPVFTLGNDTSFCSGGMTTLVAPMGGYSYMWSDSTTNDSLMVMSGGNYWLLVTDTVNGCGVTDSIMVSVNPLPVFTLGNDSVLCSANAPVILTGPAGGYSYMWSDSTVNSSLSVSSTGMYILMVTDTTTGCAWNDSITVTVNATPVFTLGSDTTVCGSILLSGPSGSYNYMWSDSTVNSSLSASSSGTYSLMVTDSVTGCAWNDSIVVAVNPVPPLNLGADTAVCGTSYTLNAPAGPYSYLWSDNSTGSSLNVNTTGSTWVTVTDTANGCGSTDSIMVTLNAPPVATFVLADNSVCVDDGAVTLSGTPNGGTFSGAGVTANSFNPPVAGIGSHVITYTYTDVNNCTATATDTITVSACVGVGEISSLVNGVNVFPNPNNGAFVLTIDRADFRELTIELMSLEGKRVYSFMTENVSGQFVKQIEMSNLANGTYYLRITTEQETIVRKVVRNQ
ncbi:MAG: hypothetical protein FD123_1847 [Bacteroidetes bacterium]|nr:MAG: hypothetical protein FD123_1847 [Bacteroidota bacterium]